MTNIIYNTPQIQSWQSELSPLSFQIQGHSNRVNEHNNALIPLQSQFQVLQSQISSIESQIALAELRASEDRRYHQQLAYQYDYHHRHHHHHHHSPQPGFWHAVGDVASAINTGLLYSQLNSLRADIRPVQSQMQIHIDQINSSNAIIQNSRARIQWIEYHIAEGSKFLQTLRSRPSDLLTPLKNKIIDSFRRYNDKNPSGRSPQVRICLLNIEEKIDFFSSDPNQNDIRTLQINYLQFCAFLASMRIQVRSENKDEEFINLLDLIIDETHISSDGDLPDEMQTRSSASTLFAAIQRVKADLFLMNEQSLSIKEQSIFAEEVARIQTRVVYESELQNKINSAVRLIRLEVESKKQKNEDIDYHFYNRALKDLYQVAFHSQDHTTANHLGQLAESASGAPSVGKKVAGALIAVLGILVIAASIAFIALTAGVSSFLSGFGVALGLTLIQSQITICVCVPLTVLAGSGLTFWGSTKFKEGMQQGVSKELEAVKEEVLHPTPLGV